MTRKTFYLGKQGKKFGPFNKEELDALRSSGEIQQYTYLWDPEKADWVVLELPPPAPAMEIASAAEEVAEKPSWATLNAICHNFNRILSGQLENITDSGCDLISKDGGDSPQLGIGSPLVINLFDPLKNQAMNVPASLSHVSHDGVSWIYHLTWPNRPNL